jgi:hypothetical protein
MFSSLGVTGHDLKYALLVPELSLMGIFVSHSVLIKSLSNCSKLGESRELAQVKRRPERFNSLKSGLSIQALKKGPPVIIFVIILFTWSSDDIKVSTN